MGKRYSYSVVVEQSGRLVIGSGDDAREVPPPREAFDEPYGPLGWALDQVRETFRQIVSAAPGSELTLSVRDLRPGGVDRRARFTDPDGGIDLPSLLGRPIPSTPRRPERPNGTSAAQPTASPRAPHVAPLGPSLAPTGVAPESPAAVHPSGPAVHASPPGGGDRGLAAPASTQSAARADREHGDSNGSGLQTLAPAPAMPTQVSQAPHVAQPPQPAPPQRSVARVREPATDQLEIKAERTSVQHLEHHLELQGAQAPRPGWVKIAPEVNSRPHIGGPEEKNASPKERVLNEKRRQQLYIGAVVFVVAVLVIVGFRVFNSGTSYEAYCVDQRTMTRAASGVACEDAAETNFRWWYVNSKDPQPGVGDTVSGGEGSFRAPTGQKDTVSKHVEAPASTD